MFSFSFVPIRVHQNYLFQLNIYVYIAILVHQNYLFGLCIYVYIAILRIENIDDRFNSLIVRYIHFDYRAIDR